MLYSRVIASEWYRKAAEQGHADAQYALGEAYKYGHGVEEDREQAAHWYQKAADQGHEEAQASLPVAPRLPKREPEAGEYEYMWGHLYEDGIGAVEQDFEQAAHWFRRAAELGMADAQYRLGYAYSHGVGVGQDIGQAVHWFRKAADQGQEEAQYYLGWSLAYGVAEEKDPEQAAYWWKKEAELGDADAQYALGLAYHLGEGVEQDFEQAVHWWKKAAEQGRAKAQYHLGEAYLSGEGVERDIGQGDHWLMQAAEQGDAWAQKEVKYREMLTKGFREMGKKLEQDAAQAAQAAHMHRQAANLGDADAQYALGLALPCTQKKDWTMGVLRFM